MANIFLTYLGISATVGAVVLLILLASPLINRRYAAKWKYYIWIFLAIRLLIPVSGMYHKEPESKAPAVSNIAPASALSVSEPVEMVQPQVQPQIQPQPRRFVLEIPIEAAGQVAGTPDTTGVRREPSLFDMVFSAWIAGIIISAAVPVLSCLHCKHKITRGGERIEAGGEYEIFLRMKSRLKIKRKLALIRYPKAASPMIIGFIKPALVLPCDEYSDKELEFIIRHELIHLKRGDVYIKLLCVLANAVHWFNPLIWIMRREAAIDMELSCDEGVIKGADIGVKKAYTETLLSSLSRQSSKGSTLTTQFYGGKKTMKKRFTNILSHTAKKNGAALLVWAIVLAIISGSMVGCSQAAPKSAPENTPEKTHAAAPDTNPDTTPEVTPAPSPNAAPAEERVVIEESVRILSSFRNVSENGELYMESPSNGSPQLLYYMDYDSMESRAVCPDSKCRHALLTNTGCTARGNYVYTCIIGSKLYGFERVYDTDGYYSERENGKTLTREDGITVWTADIDGSNKTQIDTVGLDMWDYMNAALIGSKIYFIGMDRTYQEEKLDEGVSVNMFDKFYLCSYDFLQKEFVNHGFLCEGYNGSASFNGVYNGGLYFSTSIDSEVFRYDYDDSFWGGDPEDPEYKKAHDDWSKAYKEFEDKYSEYRECRFDLESGEITDSDLPLSSAAFLTDSLYGYMTENPDKEHSYLLNIPYGDGDIRVYKDYSYVGRPINGYLFINDKTAVDIATGEERKLRDGAVPQYYSVQAYHNGRYIIKSDTVPREYMAIPEENMFED